MTRDLEPTHRRRPSRLAALLPAMLVLAVLGTSGGSLASSTSAADGPLVDLTVTSSSTPTR